MERNIMTEEQKQTPTTEELLKRVETIEQESAKDKQTIKDLTSQLETTKKAKEEVELKLATLKLSGQTQTQTKQTETTQDEVVEYNFVY